MGNTALEKLYFSIGIIDRVTKPGGKINKEIQKIQRTARTGFMEVGKGALTIGATGAAFLKFTDSARGFDNSLKEVRSLGVHEKELDRLGKAALDFSSMFGGAAADVVASGYDIQSAIEGLDNGELAKFTYNSALLAKATKSDAGTITGYVATMSGVFDKDMAVLGKSEWIDQLTGKTAAAVRMFRTTGGEMQAAFAQLGSSGSTLGVGMDEQMAVLGMLQAVTGSGSVAATQYRGFLEQAAKAQDKLGLSFQDSQGNMLPMADILEKIRGKYGDTIDLAESKELKDAFGSSEAVKAVTSLIGKTEALRKNTAAIGDVKGIDTAMKMAEAQIDPVEAAKAAWESLRIVLGTTLLPVLDKVATGTAVILRLVKHMVDRFPPLRWVFAAVAVAATSLAMALGTMWTVMGAVHIIKSFAGMMVVMKRAMTASSIATYKNIVAAKAHLVASKIAAAATYIWTGAQWAINAAMYANPVGIVVLAIVALIGVIVALYKNWDRMGMKMKIFFAIMMPLPMLIVWIIKNFGRLKAAGGAAMDFLIENWKMMLLAISGPVGWTIGLIIKHFDKIKGAFLGIRQFGISVMQNLIRLILAKVEGLLVRLSKLPVIGKKIKAGLEKMREFGGVDVNQTAISQPVVGSVGSDRRNLDTPAGGARTTTNRTTNYGGVNIYNSSGIDAASLEESLVLAAG